MKNEEDLSYLSLNKIVIHKYKIKIYQKIILFFFYILNKLHVNCIIISSSNVTFNFRYNKNYSFVIFISPP